jgi:DNA-binding GntR family transcriptional regulator
MKQFFTFDRRKKTSTVEQMIEQIIGYINDYKLISGSPLPQIEVTSTELALTKNEVNQILQTLLKQGYLLLDPKTNTYLVQKPNKDNEFLISISPIYKEIINHGKTPKIYTIEKTTLTVTAEISQLTGFSIGEQIIRTRRYFTANDTPMAYLEFYLSLDRLPQVDQLFNGETPHLEMIMSKFPSQYKYHVREFKIIEAPLWVKEILQSKDHGMICNHGKYRFYNQAGQIVESGFTYLTELTEFTTTTTDLNMLFV